MPYHESDAVFTRRLPQTDPRLGRHVVHDPRSRGFARPTTVDRSTWHDKAVRIYDPRPNPNQTIGNCTGVAKCVQFNAVGDRVMGQVLRMADADRIYAKATELDPFPGTWPPDDSGSSGLGAAKAAQALGLGGAYYWLFGGADDVVQAIIDDDVVNVGTRWDAGMMRPDVDGFVHPGGAVAGGHEYSARGYVTHLDAVIIRCWWGDFRDVLIKRGDLDELLADDGDCHVQERAA